MKWFMKKGIFILVLSVFYLTIYAKEYGEFGLKVKQDGKFIEVDSSQTAFLRPDKFQLVFVFDDSIDFLVNASIEDTTFRQSLKGSELDDLKGFIQLGKEMRPFLRNTCYN